ncbi:DNA-binding transcriptional LysR family regulator [Bradyrhizobium sp. i1.4.4]
MDVRKLRYFIVLAAERHFGRAARKLSLSQPPLSYAIQQLEAELGAQLFTRNSRNVRLTPAGVTLQREAQVLLRRIEETRQLVKSVAEGKDGQLRVGFGGSMLYRGLPAIVKSFRLSFPGIELNLREMSSFDQMESLHREEIDLGFVHGRATPAGLNGFCYHSEPFVVCLPQDHAYARARRVKLSQLDKDDFVLFSRKGSPDYFESIIGTCLSAGFVPKVRHEVGHWLSVVSFVANGMGVALVPRTLANSHLAGAVFVTVEETTIRSETWCVWNSESATDAVLANAIDLVRAHSTGMKHRRAPTARLRQGRTA